MAEAETDSSVRPGSILVVAGMHRSGTSLAASILSAHGIRMGTDLAAADRNNQAGYYEDPGFGELQKRMLWDGTAPDDGGHRDWGWTEHEQLDRSAFDRHLEAASELVERRSREAGTQPWGWKNPRTTVQLDFWDRVLAQPRYLLLYRYPWEVADSMQRLGADVFLRHPQYAYRIWEFYNRQLLDFKERVGDRAVVVGAGAMVANPAAFGELVRRRFPSSDAAGDAAGKVRPALFHTTQVPTALVQILERVRPECLTVLRQLERVADLPYGMPPAAVPRHRTRPPQPRLSIIIPCYNHGEFLIEAVASAEDGSAAETTEILIVNDGSTEPWTLTVLEHLRALGYTVLDTANGGVARARNLAAGAARGTYLLPLDADNRIRQGFAAAAMTILDTRPEVGVVYSDRHDFGLRAAEVAVPEFHLPTLLLGNYIDACAVVRRLVWEQCQGWDTEMLGWQDWEFWITAAERGWQFAHWTEVGFDYRVRPDSMVAHTARKGRHVQEYIVRKHEATYRQLLPDWVEVVHGHLREKSRAMYEAIELRRQIEAARVVEAELERSIRTLQAEHESLVAEVDSLASAATDHRYERDRARSADARGRAEATAASTERDGLRTELEAWRQRVAGMEETNAWRLRARILRLRGRLHSS